jgi:hypothetical protein
MNDRINEIRARLQAATPGPWKIDPDDPTKFESIVSTADDRPWGWVEVARSIGPDAKLIANAPEDIAYLLERLEAFAPVLTRLDAHPTITTTYGNAAALIRTALEGK